MIVPISGFQINHQPLDLTKLQPASPRESGQFPAMREMAVPIQSARECGYVEFRDLRCETYTPLDVSFDPPVVTPQCDNLALLGDDSSSAVVKGDTTILYDLGRVIKGTFEIEADFPEGTTLTFGIGEAKEPLRTYKASGRADGMRQTFRPDIGVTAGMQYTGLRYVWLRVEGLSLPAHIYNAKGVLRYYPCTYQGKFKCSDEMLNKIWDMSAYSAMLCMESDWPTPAIEGDEKQHCVTTALIFDRVDRFPWIGDSRIIFNVLLSIFGEHEFVKDSLDFYLPKSVNSEGGWPKGHVCIINLPPYLLDWILALAYYAEYTGDKEELENRLPMVMQVFEQWGKYHTPAGFYFIDWDERVMLHRDTMVEEPIMTEAWPAFMHKYMEALRETARLCEFFGLADYGNRCRVILEERVESWKRIYPDWAKRFDIHAITNGILAGIDNAADDEIAYERVYKDKMYRCTGTPYFGYHVLRALAKIGRWEEAIEMLRLYWGKMIALGATTVWEGFEVSWDLAEGQQPPQPYGWGCNSLCQPAGSGPAEWLLREITGIRPLEPGFRRLLIKPYIPKDLDWAEGAIATKQGIVSVTWKKSGNGIVNICLNIPKGIEETVLVMPDMSSATVRGNPASFSNTDSGDACIVIRETGTVDIEVSVKR